jgi:hypothetical protein
MEQSTGPFTEKQYQTAKKYLSQMGYDISALSPEKLDLLYGMFYITFLLILPFYLE